MLRTRREKRLGVGFSENALLRAHSENAIQACCETIPAHAPAALAQTPGRGSEKRSPPARAPRFRPRSSAPAPARSARQSAPAPPIRRACTSRVATLPRVGHIDFLQIVCPRPIRTAATWRRYGFRCAMRSRVSAEHPAGRNSFSPSTASFPACACRQAVEPQNAEGQRGVDGGLCLLRVHAQAPQSRTAPAAEAPANRSVRRTAPDPSAVAEPDHGRRESGAPACAAASADRPDAPLVVPWERAGRVRGRFPVCWDASGPSRCTASRSTSFLISTSSTRRTTLRSADHKCSRHLLLSPEMEYLDWARSNTTAPFSSTTAPRDPARKSSTVRARVSGGHGEL